jgi:hypothetical protein
VLGLGPLAGTPPAKADVLDLVIDPIVKRLQAAMTGATDAFAVWTPPRVWVPWQVCIPPPIWPV